MRCALRAPSFVRHRSNHGLLFSTKPPAEAKEKAGAAAAATAAAAAAAASTETKVVSVKADNVYVKFAKEYPSANNLIIATIKTGGADLLAQMAVEGKGVSEVDWKRNAVFCMFGGAYLGMFQYWYQINIFKKIFPASVERFTTLPLKEKLADVPGLKALAGQTVLDVSMLSFVYLPTFYSFKAGVFDKEGVGPVGWVKTGTGQWMNNFSSDAVKIVQFWTPVDIVCFSIPLYLRLPVRHIFSFMWTAYLSVIRGANK
jgi:hypothetical protein